MRLDAPKNVRGVRRFLGIINFIKNHIPNRAQMLAPLTNLTKKESRWRWGEKEQEAFDKTLAATSNAILCTFPDSNKPYIIYPDAAQKHGMGALLCQVQDGKETTISTYSEKFNDAQLKYPVGEQELLAAHRACRHFRQIILGSEVLIRTDHKNLTFDEVKHASLRVLRQRIEIDQEYGATFEHLAGDLNVGADGLSRHDATSTTPIRIVEEVYAVDELDRNENEDFPIAMRLVKEEQDKDAAFQALLSKPETAARFTTKEYDGVSVHCFEDRVWTPPALQKRIVEWYHNNLLHAGSTRTLKTIQQTFRWNHMRKHVDEHVKTCDQCQRYKIVGRPNYGLIPNTGALRNKNPWEKIQVDCAGPWKVNVSSATGEKVTFSFHIVTIADCCTNWCELQVITSAASKKCAGALDTQWLCRYPRPKECGHDNGPEFMGAEFQELLTSFGIKSRPTTVKNPTANGIVERLHLTLADQLRTRVFEEDWHQDVNLLAQTCA